MVAVAQCWQDAPRRFSPFSLLGNFLRLLLVELLQNSLFLQNNLTFQL